MSREPHSKNAFTLVEVLVVIGVIAVLVAILIPVLGIARQEAQSVQCLSNLRQLGMTASTYCNNNDGRFPIAYYTDVRHVYNCWDFSYVPAASGPPTIVPGVLWGIDISGQQLQKCPSYDGKVDSFNDPYTGYNYNTSYIGHGELELIVAPIKATQVNNPGSIALFGDGEYWSGPDKFMRSPFPSPSETGIFFYAGSGTQAYRHRNRTNVCYCDGHAASISDLFTTSIDPHIGPGTGFLSKDNSAYDPGMKE